MILPKKPWRIWIENVEYYVKETELRAVNDPQDRIPLERIESIDGNVHYLIKRFSKEHHVRV